MGQLLATQAKLWDASTASTSVSGAASGNEPGDHSDRSTAMSSASHPVPPVALRQAGTHRLAWSRDGSRSTSESDT